LIAARNWRTQGEKSYAQQWRAIAEEIKADSWPTRRCRGARPSATATTRVDASLLLVP